MYLLFQLVALLVALFQHDGRGRKKTFVYNKSLAHIFNKPTLFFYILCFSFSV
jgi:hypothetical protein